MKLTTKLLLLGVFSLTAFIGNAASMPDCPAYPAAQPLFLNVPSVTQSTEVAGYQLSQYVSGDSNGITTSYNYFSQTSRTPADALQQIHNLSALLHTVPGEDAYQIGDVNYKQCVYWGSMSGQGVPTGNQVLSIQYSQAAPPQPGVALSLQQVQALPSSTVVGRTYIVVYKLNNSNAKAINYTLKQTNAPYVVFNEQINNACNVQDQQVALAANSSCNIQLQFNDPKVETYPSTEVMTLDADTGVQPDSITLTTNVQKILAENMIIFGDSLTDVCSPGPYTNNDPVKGKRVWIQDFLAETAVYAQGLNCWKNPGVDILDHNVDFAIGGARITGGNEQINIPAQIASYEAILAEHKTPGGGPVKPGLNTKFIFWIGGNDLLGYDLNQPDAKAKQDMIDLADHVVDMIQAFATTNSIPASNIYIINLPNIGAAAGHQVLEFTKLVGWFNAELTAAVSKFSAPNNLKPTVIDSYNPGMGLFIYVMTGSTDPSSKYAKYGFQKALMMTPCNSAEHGATQACKGYMSWDGTHPTVELHQFFADSFADFVDPKLSTFDK